jgi:hypothetical protein
VLADYVFCDAGWHDETRYPLRGRLTGRLDLLERCGLLGGINRLSGNDWIGDVHPWAAGSAELGHAVPRVSPYSVPYVSDECI